ncbi:hypothetical protein MSG28_012944 [Choristoneura fumiferana]|uniref:Uncharacterized protein n=1 Tax=Choristoneura fumiferana TaxID=7141 RepID=A0ACC0KRS0_CHOFU|nr:hypothetical protein MSG28_012944 [Choristoneura fumiferana]
MNLEHILGIQVLFLGGVTFGYHSSKMDSENLFRILLLVARFVICLLTSQALELACATIYTSVKTRQLPEIRFKEKFKVSLYVLVSSIGLLVYHNLPLIGEEFVLLLIASAGVRYLEAKRQFATITYGEGMACSFAEGYLYQVIP